MKAYSVDLRERVVAAVERGMARRLVAEQFQVSLPTIKRWLRRRHRTGSLAPTPHPGPPSVKKAAIRAHALPLLEARPDATLAEHCRAFAEQHGIPVSPATMCRVIVRHFDWTRKKKALSASERDETVRATWREQSVDVDTTRWVFVDETGSHLGFTRRYARAPRGERAHGSAPRNTGVNHTVITAMSAEGMLPSVIVEGGVTSRTFEMWVAHCLVPHLWAGDVVAMDNLRAHHSLRVRELIAARGAELRYLPSYSPDLNPIVESFSKLKGWLRTAEARTEEALYAAIRTGLRAITPGDVQGWFRQCGYSVGIN